MDIILNITSNSKEIKPGGMFIAIAGSAFDGHNYINQAINAGASYIVAEKYPEELGITQAKLLSQYADEAPTIATFEVTKADGGLVVWDVVANSRLAYAGWAQQAYPNQPGHMVAVTGTNGKTSTTWFFQQILALLGYSSACIGTIGVISNITLDQSLQGPSLTTPDALGLHKMLESLAENGVEFAAMEASSHAIHQDRLSAVLLKAAAFTNFTQDHLDYHGTMEEYLAAKTRLFSHLLPSNGTAVLNKDIEQFPGLLNICQSRGVKVLTYGADAADITYQAGEGNAMTLKIIGQEYRTQFNVIGDFQKYNLMAAIGLLIACGIDHADIIQAIPFLLAPTGRMEWVAMHNGANIFVDYAHTPDALQRALEALRSSTNGKTHLVFGCGGNRDKQKRPLMGKIAANYADKVVVTDDNPRLEDASLIREEIMATCPNAQEVAGRDQAIRIAMNSLMPGDSLLVAGKGHEEYQIIGTQTLPFSDRKHILNYTGEQA